jgi:hypothetical protein
VPRLLLRERDGGLVDESDGRPVTLAELREDVRAGRRFRARRAGGGLCTYALLAELLTGSEPGIGSAAAARPGPGAVLERALRGVFDSDDDASGERRRRERPRRRPGRASGPGG